MCLRTLTFVRGEPHRTYLSGGGLVMTQQMCAWLRAGHHQSELWITRPPGPVLSRPPPYGSPLLHIEMHSHLEVQVGTIKKTLSIRRAPLGQPSKRGVGKPHLGAKSLTSPSYRSWQRPAGSSPLMSIQNSRPTSPYCLTLPYQLATCTSGRQTVGAIWAPQPVYILL